jgi:hypothetical protein
MNTEACFPLSKYMQARVQSLHWMPAAGQVHGATATASAPLEATCSILANPYLPVSILPGTTVPT